MTKTGDSEPVRAGDLAKQGGGHSEGTSVNPYDPPAYEGDDNNPTTPETPSAKSAAGQEVSVGPDGIAWHPDDQNRPSGEPVE